jgi:hypothetical protein
VVPEPESAGPRVDPEACSACAKLDEHLEAMLEAKIKPAELSFKEAEWEQFRRDYATNPERALATLEKKFDIHGNPARSTKPSAEASAAEREALADDVRNQANPRTSKSTTRPEREAAAAEAHERAAGTTTDEPDTVPDGRPEGGLFDDPNAEALAAQERLRNAYMGNTPSKFSETGAVVVERMRGAKLIEGEGPLLPGNPNGLKVKAPDGTWHLIDETIDMSHYPTDAVRWWNDEGKYYGAQSGPVREWMKDPDNYRLEPRSSNRSAGAKLGERYDPPEK